MKHKFVCMFILIGMGLIGVAKVETQEGLYTIDQLKAVEKITAGGLSAASAGKLLVGDDLGNEQISWITEVARLIHDVTASAIQDESKFMKLVKIADAISKAKDGGVLKEWTDKIDISKVDLSKIDYNTDKSVNINNSFKTPLYQKDHFDKSVVKAERRQVKFGEVTSDILCGHMPIPAGGVKIGYVEGGTAAWHRSKEVLMAAVFAILKEISHEMSGKYFIDGLVMPQGATLSKEQQTILKRGSRAATNALIDTILMDVIRQKLASTSCPVLGLGSVNTTEGFCEVFYKPFVINLSIGLMYELAGYLTAKGIIQDEDEEKAITEIIEDEARGEAVTDEIVEEVVAEEICNECETRIVEDEARSAEENSEEDSVENSFAETVEE
jgi:hypothetical protein